MTDQTSNTKQEYTYSLKSVAFADSGNLLCSSELWFQVRPPDDYIALKRLQFHLILLFDAGVSSGDRQINQIGITDSAVTGLPDATYSNLVTINRSADVNRKIDLSINLTSLLKPSTNNNHYVYVKFPKFYTTDGVNGGSVLLCKADALFTTTGIR